MGLGMTLHFAPFVFLRLNAFGLNEPPLAEGGSGAFFGGLGNFFFLKARGEVGSTLLCPDGPGRAAGAGTLPKLGRAAGWY